MEGNMKISTIRGLAQYLKNNSAFSVHTIHSVIIALGYNPQHSTAKEFKEISRVFIECSEHGADSGFSGFIYYSDTVPFFIENRECIVSHMEHTAAELGTDIISMVQGFDVSRFSGKPTPSEVGKALWDSGQQWEELTNLYNVFAWYALEEISRTWYRYLEENPSYHVALSA
jgi:hypothetical protein